MLYQVRLSCQNNAEMEQFFKQVMKLQYFLTLLKLGFDNAHLF